MWMAEIKVLSDQLINLIAAGEVVEDPTSALKELIENSLDAEADKITIRIEEGGYTLLSVEDNGIGMDRENAKKAILRHATSKLEREEDLSSLATMGFRGEALASMAAVSQMEILSSVDGISGIELVVKHGKIIEEREGARVKGTTLSLRHLFSHLPARMRFQKSPASSVTKMIRLLSALSCSHPDIQFLLYQRKELLFSAYPSRAADKKEKMANRIREVLGKETFERMIRIDHKQDKYAVEGFISPPGSGKKNRLGQYLFINNRWIFSPFLSRHIKEMYGTALNKEEHPLFVLSLTIPSYAVDVNVHPQKKEIRFQDTLFIASFIEEALKKKLLPQGISFTPTPYMQKFPWEEESSKEKIASYSPSLPLEQPTFFTPSYRVVKKVDRFLFAEKEEKLFLVSLPLLYHRVTEKFFTQKEKTLPLQTLLFSYTFSLSKEQMAQALEKKALFAQIGLSVRWNAHSLSFTSIPAWMDEASFQEAFFSFLEGSKKRKSMGMPLLSLGKWEEILQLAPEDCFSEIGEKECMMLWEKVKK